jgi:hypothetical protein
MSNDRPHVLQIDLNVQEGLSVSSTNEHSRFAFGFDSGCMYSFFPFSLFFVKKGAVSCFGHWILSHQSLSANIHCMINPLSILDLEGSCEIGVDACDMMEHFQFLFVVSC